MAKRQAELLDVIERVSLKIEIIYLPIERRVDC